MDKNKKAVLIVLLSLIISVCCFVACEQKISPTDGVIYRVSEDGTYAEVVGYEGDSQSVRIAEVYDNVPVTRIGEYAFYNCKNISKIELHSRITSIGNLAFACCENLSEIIIPNSITELGVQIFYRCDNLKYTNYGNAKYIGDEQNAYVMLVEVNSDNMSECLINENTKYICGGAFLNCKDLSEITIPTGVTCVGDWAFAFCNKLKKVNIPDSVLNVGEQTFLSCTNLSNITVDENNKNYKSLDGNLYNKNGDALLQYAIGKTNESFEIPNGVTTIRKYAFYECSNIDKVIIPSSVVKIEECAFYDCSLSKLTISDGVKYIDDNAFCYCDKITELTIPGSVIDIGKRAFYSCDGIIHVNLSYGLKNIDDEAFGYCSKLEEVYMPTSIKSIGRDVFSGCGKLEYNEKEGLCYLGGNLIKHVALIKVSSTNKTNYIISDMASVIADNAFSGCSKACEIKIPSDIIYIGDGAFADCGNLINITVEEDNEYYKSLDGNLYSKDGKTLLQYCAGKTNESFEIPSIVTTISSCAFYKNDHIKEITIGGNVGNIGTTVFTGCSNLANITVKENNEHYKSIDGNLYSKDGKTLLQYAIGKENDSFDMPSGVTNVESGAFLGGKNLVKIILSSELTNISDNAFYGCSALSDIVISDSVTNIGNSAFYGCKELVSVTIGRKVVSIGYNAFNGCTKLIEVVNKSNVEIDLESSLNYYGFGSSVLDVKTSEESGVVNVNNYLFYTHKGTNYLIGYIGDETNLVLPDDYCGKEYEIYEYAFYNRDNLTSIAIPNSVTSIGGSAFSGCSSLTSITIPDSVTSIEEGAFSGCSSLKEITIPFVGAKAEVLPTDTYQYPFGYIFGSASYTGGTKTRQYYRYGSSVNSTTYDDYYVPSSLTSVTVTGGNIFYGAFENCNKLTEIAIPSSATSIGDYAFYNCSITEITIPESVTRIGKSAFYDCSKLTSVYYKGSESEWKKISISSGNTYLTNATRYYLTETSDVDLGVITNASASNIDGLIARKGKVLLDFWADDCYYCTQVLAPQLETFIQNYNNGSAAEVALDIKIVKVRVGSSYSLAESTLDKELYPYYQRYLRSGMGGLPYVVLLDDGEVIGALNGAYNEYSQLLSWLQNPTK